MISQPSPSYAPLDCPVSGTTWVPSSLCSFQVPPLSTSDSFCPFNESVTMFPAHQAQHQRRPFELPQ